MSWRCSRLGLLLRSSPPRAFVSDARDQLLQFYRPHTPRGERERGGEEVPHFIHQKREHRLAGPAAATRADGRRGI